MNGVMKNLVSQLLNNQIGAARSTAAIFPSIYGSKLLGDDGFLTEYGINEALQYPFPQKLGKELVKCMSDVKSASIVETEFFAYNKVFKLIEPESKMLSQFAIIKAIQSMSLKGQCSALGWPLTTMTAHKKIGKKAWTTKLAKDLYPEQVVMFSVMSSGGKCSWCEGGSVNLMLKAAILEVLVSHNLYNGEDREDAISGFLESHLTLLNNHKGELIDCAERISDSELKNNIAEVCSNSLIKEFYPRVREDFLHSLVENMSVDLRIRLLETYMVNPYGYRAGWPDLIVLNNGEISFVEVKTTDRFHDSQLRFATEVAAPLGLKCQVIQVIPEQ